MKAIPFHKCILVFEVGVSGLSLVAQDQGVPLASNQVQYSLLYRLPERNGVVDACKDTGTALLAYSPITQGLLSGAGHLRHTVASFAELCPCFADHTLL